MWLHRIIIIPLNNYSAKMALLVYRGSKKARQRTLSSQCSTVSAFWYLGITNHSLRATGTTEEFAANVTEKLIQSRTGHRSVEALRLYERPSYNQHQAVSNVLTLVELQRSFSKELTIGNLRSSASHCTGVISRSTAENRAMRSTTAGSPFPTGFQMPALFENMNNCSVDINVNMNQSAVNVSVEKEFDQLVSDVNFEF